MLPAPQVPRDEQSRRLDLAPVGEFGLQPVEGPAAEFRLRRAAMRRLILGLSGGGQDGCAGSSVPVKGAKR